MSAAVRGAKRAHTIRNPQSQIRNQQDRWFLVQIKEIVDFEMALSTAQATDDAAGNLDAQGGNGGPQSLVPQEFFHGGNQEQSLLRLVGHALALGQREPPG